MPSRKCRNFNRTTLSIRGRCTRLHPRQLRLCNFECPKISVLCRSPARSGKQWSSQHQEPAACRAELIGVPHPKLLVTRQGADRIRLPVPLGLPAPMADRYPRWRHQCGKPVEQRQRRARQSAGPVGAWLGAVVNQRLGIALVQMLQSEGRAQPARTRRCRRRAQIPRQGCRRPCAPAHSGTHRSDG